MGLTVTLETAEGTRLAVVEDPTNVLHRALPPSDDASFKWARTIEWYGDTTFNYLQAEALRQEWGRIIRAAADTASGSLLREVDELLRRCTEGRHLYVKCHGD
jgi:hypothetical protein